MPYYKCGYFTITIDNALIRKNLNTAILYLIFKNMSYTLFYRLKEQEEAFNTQKKEYERELNYLRLLLKEKEEIINCLEMDKK